MPAPNRRADTARRRAAVALAAAAERFPALGPTPIDVAGLDERESRLALAIHRGALQRWITLEYVLDHFLRQPMHQLEPKLRGVLLSGAAQLLCLDRLPTHAVVDESVELARTLVRPKAAGLVNAVLRRVGALIGAHVTGQWRPSREQLPVETGFAPLSEPVLPPVEPIDAHLAVATSHPVGVIRDWISRFGVEQATAVALHSILNPPLIVALEPGFDIAAEPRLRPHAEAGFALWQGPAGELGGFLAGDEHRRVQDPAAADAVAATAGLSVTRVLDYCAGRGTKTRQLAALHRGAAIVTTDTHRERLRELREQFGRHPRVKVFEPELEWEGAVSRGGVRGTRRSQGREAPGLGGSLFDLVVLDVPCTNTAVLARRPEARYRHTPGEVRKLADLQRSIIERTVPLIRPGGHLLYSTCSLEPAENDKNARFAANLLNGEIINEHQRLPAGRDDAYHDGSYYALVWRKG